ncbi:MoxR family ATPase [Pacificimonas sp. WHA3]|uniref:MoxR family ATPase n=1 Tax=Pacificimonas pallii TaxID=2827236 RepID=A0ABS6SGP0_9SPHN|nr:MoxR family ATPase [Pacificimonas pallii]MBV7257081.1 MoxR family ATPase [Pacificimonas pallii]
MNQPNPAPVAAEAVARLDALAIRFGEAREEISRSIIGQPEIIEQVIVTILAGGHALLVGLPGLAKTRLVKTVGTVLGLGTSRVQFTPDLVPSDILGAEVLETGKDGSRAFRFVKGPIFAQLLMADEINRASPRTQSALLEAMQERQVTAAGEARMLPAPFHVLATQNPIEQDGTYPLPEAQLDRFLMQVNVDFPSEADERDMLLMTTGAEDAAPKPVLRAEELMEAQTLLTHMPLSEDVLDAILTTVRGLRPAAGNDVPLSWGPGPRAGQALILAARARAFLHGRSAPLLEDVHALLAPVLRHRMALDYAARADGRTIEAVIADAAARL